MKVNFPGAAVLLAACCVNFPVVAQIPQPIYDRAPLYRAGQATSDDVQRRPVPPRARPAVSFVLVGGRVIDGNGGPARPATVVVEGNVITAILPPGVSGWPAAAKVHDVSGKTVMPGLIDLHTHLTYVEEFGAPPALSSENEAEATLRGLYRMRIFAQSGVTSVRDVGSDGAVPFALKRWQAEGRVPGPRVFAAGQLIVGRGGHGTENYAVRTAPENPHSTVREASGPDEWRDAVRLQFKQGADVIKLASHYAQDEIDAAVDEAHALGLPVTVDAETHYIDMAIKAGADIIEHPLPRSDAAIQLMAKKRIASVPTLIPYRYIIRFAGGYYGSTSRRFALDNDTIMAMFKKLRASGVKLGVGTDLISDWIKYYPAPLIGELKMFVEGGYSTMEALTAATKTNAEILRMDDRLGTLAVGKLADIIVVDGQPDSRLEDLAKIDLVFLDGRLTVEGGQLVPSVHIPAALPRPVVPATAQDGR